MQLSLKDDQLGEASRIAVAGAACSKASHHCGFPETKCSADALPPVCRGDASGSQDGIDRGQEVLLAEQRRGGSRHESRRMAGFVCKSPVRIEEESSVRGVV